ncbi:MAG: TraR/DksA C4-type zinc finger protein [Chthoniobacteraceae bacterium]
MELGTMKAQSHFPTRTPASRVSRKWRWHCRALQRLRDHLVDDLCIKLAQAAQRTGRTGMGSADSASGESDRALAVSLLSGEEDALHEVDSALRRIRAGTFGICERSGKRIPAERLRAIPWTRFTKEAEDEIENESRGGRKKTRPSTTGKPVAITRRSRQAESHERPPT